MSLFSFAFFLPSPPRKKKGGEERGEREKRGKEEEGGRRREGRESRKDKAEEGKLEEDILK